MKKNIRWSSTFGFLLSTLGATIGLGSVWRFPSIAYESGGLSFIIIYFISIFFIGFPLVVLEMAIGHRYRASLPSALRSISTKFEWIGWMALFVGAGIFGLTIYYCVIISWCILYFIYSFSFAWGANPLVFFETDVIQKSSNFFEIGAYQTNIIVSLGVVWILMAFVIKKQISKGVELLNRVLIPLLLGISIFLLLWTIFLDGASIGIKEYLYFQVADLWNYKIWFQALNQVFFSLSIAFGVLPLFASYLGKDKNLVQLGAIISYGTAIFATLFGFIIFSILGFISYESGIPVKEISSNSGNLPFITFPKAFNTMAEFYPILSQFVAVLFFFSLVIAGFSTSIANVKAINDSLYERFSARVSRSVFTYILCIVGFLSGTFLYTHQAGIYWFEFFDEIFISHALLIIGLFMCLFIAWNKKAYNDIILNHIGSFIPQKLSFILKPTFCFFIPSVIFLILVQTAFNNMQDAMYDFSFFKLSLLIIASSFTVFLSLGFQFYKKKSD